MKLTLFALLITASLSGYAAEQMIPAGSIVQCTVSEPKLSSKTTDIGDPVLCQVGHVELYGRSVFPYGSYLEGRFEDYKDPGHFVGKGWMELKFDRMFIPPGEIIPVSAKVVYVPKYDVDKQGRIHGKGHATRDTLEWMVPVLWPIDLITLPRRGPRPVLKPETRLTLKIMDDFGVPMAEQASYQPTYTAPRDQYGFSQRAPMTYAPSATPPPPSYIYVPPALPLYPPINYSSPQPVPPSVLILRDGHRVFAKRYWSDAYGQMHYIALNGTHMIFPIEMLDVPASTAVNHSQGIDFAMNFGTY